MVIKEDVPKRLNDLLNQRVGKRWTVRKLVCQLDDPQSMFPFSETQRLLAELGLTVHLDPDGRWLLRVPDWFLEPSGAWDSLARRSHLVRVTVDAVVIGARWPRPMREIEV